MLPTFASEGLFSKEILGLQGLRNDVLFPDEPTLLRQYGECLQ